ncbi:MAG TPA: glycosyltransferase family 1 protein [Patescibacteria group bacterium]|nr:glycosyltransferase family 1 protein [Patescibacteria group bacterium]
MARRDPSSRTRRLLRTCGSAAPARRRLPFRDHGPRPRHLPQPEVVSRPAAAQHPAGRPAFDPSRRRHHRRVREHRPRRRRDLRRGPLSNPRGASRSFAGVSAHGCEDLAEARAKLKLPERFILFVGTIEPRKNLETLLEAWATMRDRPDLVVVGSWGWLYDTTRDRMERMGPGLHHLDNLGPSDLPAIYNLARVLAHPAWYEGFGLPPLEAMACGTPVIVSDASSLPEVVKDAGLVVPAGDAEAWRKALERVIGDTDLAADLSRKGILRAAQFSWPRAAGLTWQAFDRAIGADTQKARPKPPP